MADQESIDSFMSITGSSEVVAIQKLREHGGGLNEAVNSYFTQGDHTANLYRVRNRSMWRINGRSSPSPTLTAQRLIKEQQNDEYLASLQADREKQLLERATRDEDRKLEQLELERQVAAKKTSLPQEPAFDDDNAVTLLVRMPEGSRRCRRFMKTDKLRYLFDFIDVGRVVKPSTYRLVRPYPKRAFGDGESDLTLNQLGLTCKQEALFLELI